MTAGVALLHVSAEGFCAAKLDCTHDAALPTAQSISVLQAIGRPGLAKDFRHLEPDGAQRQPQQLAGGVGAGAGDSALGSKSKGLVVAHTVLVATFK